MLARRSNRHWLVLVLALTLLVVAACGGAPSSQGGGDQGGSSGSTGDSGGSGDETPQPAGRRVLRMTQAWPNVIDPARGSDLASSVSLINLYSTLVYPAASGDVEPYAAESWTVSDDNLTYTFQLRQGIKFHDGREMTAEDVKFSFDRLMTIGEGFAYLFRGVVREATVDDTYTVSFHLEQPFGPFLNILTRLYIVNSELVKENIKPDGPYGEMGDYGTEFLNVNDAGSGAYMVRSFDVSSELVMDRFPDFFGEVAPNAPEEVRMIGTTEAATVRTWMSNRELEISDQWQTAEALASLDNIPGIEIAGYLDGGQLYLMMHTQKPPLDDIHVRRAIAYLIDYDALVQQIFPGTQKAQGPVSRSLAGWNSSLPTLEFSLDKAREELAQSRYAGQFDQYPIEYAWTAEVPALEKIALMLQANAQQVGVTIDIVQTPWLQLIERAGSKDSTPHIASIFVSPSYGEAGSQLRAKFHSSTAGTWEQTEWLQNPEIDAMIDDALSTVDFDQRMAKYAEIQARVVELLPSAPLYDNVARHAYQACYVEWPQLDAPIPVLGYMQDARFIQVFPDRVAGCGN
ncbi:MAG TPA: ABC transporter substrate-binding protein [Bacillota bacterium]